MAMWSVQPSWSVTEFDFWLQFCNTVCHDQWRSLTFDFSFATCYFLQWLIYLQPERATSIYEGKMWLTDWVWKSVCCKAISFVMDHKLARVDSESGQHGATWRIAHMRKQWLPNLSPSLFSSLGASLLLTVQYNALVMHCVIKGKKKKSKICLRTWKHCVFIYILHTQNWYWF